MKSTAAAIGLGIALLAAATVPARAQVLEIATDQSPVGLDPQVATSFATQLVTSTIYEGLTAIDADLRVVPALASSWTVSDDGRIYRFQLRSGATFHNGRPLTPGSQELLAIEAYIGFLGEGQPAGSAPASGSRT